MSPVFVTPESLGERWKDGKLHGTLCVDLNGQPLGRADTGVDMTFDFGQLVAWPFADYVFGSDWDVMSDVTKSRLHGFHEVVDSEAMFERLLTRFRKERIVP